MNKTSHQTSDATITQEHCNTAITTFSMTGNFQATFDYLTDGLSSLTIVTSLSLIFGSTTKIFLKHHPYYLWNINVLMTSIGWRYYIKVWRISKTCLRQVFSQISRTKSSLLVLPEELSEEINRELQLAKST
jgi:DNA integrity scanning protein DisA with diadenylate cyclase activity